MVAGTLGQRQIVNVALMVERFRQMDTSARVSALCAFAMLVLVGGQSVFGAGGVIGGGSVTAAQLQQQISALTTQLTRLTDKIEQMPQAYQLTILDRHLSAQDGRMDGLDTRMRDLDTRLSKAEAKMEIIDQTSKAKLGR